MFQKSFTDTPSAPSDTNRSETEGRYSVMFRMSLPAWRRFAPYINDLGFDEAGECRLLDRLWHAGRKSMRDLLAMSRLPAGMREGVMAQIEKGDLAPWDVRKVTLEKVTITHGELAAIVTTTQSAFIALEQFQHIQEVATALNALERLQQRIVSRRPPND
jgi:hypothetical protein